MTKARILFVDDDPSVLGALTRRFRALREWEVGTAPSGQAALELLEQQAFDVVVTDMRMPATDGLALLGHVRTLQPCDTVELLGLVAPRVGECREGVTRLDPS
jgi:CheY-like chemotaxis protein